MEFNKTAIYWQIKESPLRQKILSDGFANTGIFESTLNGIGWGNGYVYIHKDLFDEDFDSIIENNAGVHGGVTYAEYEGDYFCFGFDTAHLGDSPDRWTKEDVEKETIELYEEICEYYNAKFTDNNAELLLLHKNSINSIIVEHISDKRLRGKVTYYLPNKEKYLVK